MPFNARDLAAYRRDEKYGHRIMTAEERIKLLKVAILLPHIHGRQTD